jgi:radical SAM-linked protein
MRTTTKVRLRFAKNGDLRMVSHHDLLRCLERMLRRAQLPVAQSQGFNPRPKLVFTLALALGIEGRREVLELDLEEPITPEEVLRRLAAVSPNGLRWFEAEAVPPGRPAQAEAADYHLALPDDRVEAARIALSEFLARDHWPYTRNRPDREVQLDLRPFVTEAEIGGSSALRFRIKISPNGSARPEEVVEALGLRDLLEHGAVLSRTNLILST